MRVSRCRGFILLEFCSRWNLYFKQVWEVWAYIWCFINIRHIINVHSLQVNHCFRNSFRIGESPRWKNQILSLLLLVRLNRRCSSFRLLDVHSWALKSWLPVTTPLVQMLYIDSWLQILLCCHFSSLTIILVNLVTIFGYKISSLLIWILLCADVAIVNLHVCQIRDHEINANWCTSGDTGG